MGACNSDTNPNKNIEKEKRKSNNQASNNQSSNNRNITVFRVSENTSNIKNTNNKININSNLNKDGITSFPEHSDEFKDMELFEKEVYVGEGIKKDRAYICSLKIDQLNKKRNAFWNEILKSKASTRIDTWSVIRNACYVDHGNIFLFFIYFYIERALALITKAGLRTLENSLKFCYDNSGHCYRVPNWCFNDPYVEKEFKKFSELMEIEDIHIILSEVYKNKSFMLKIKQSATGNEIKKIYMDSLQEDINKFKLRLIYNGFEIQDNQTLFEHNIQNEGMIQIVKNPINNELL